MQAKQVYEKQQQLRRAEEDLSELSNELYWERARAHQATDYFDHPAYVKANARVSAIKSEVETLQAEVGGVVYRIHDDNLTTLIDKVAKLQKRAARVDCSIEFQQVETEVEINEARNGRKRSATTWHYCTLRADRIKLADWVLLAKLSIEEAGVLVGRVPAFSRAWALHREGRGDAPDWDRPEGAPVELAQAQTVITRPRNLEKVEEEFDWTPFVGHRVWIKDKELEGVLVDAEGFGGPTIELHDGKRFYTADDQVEVLDQ